ncbi:MAG: hypothetical protein ACE5F4_00695 [Candidatus Paceibacteria bacterium]
MLFHKKTRGVMKWVWGVLVFLIIVSMLVLYSPVFYLSFGGAGVPPTHQQ